MKHPFAFQKNTSLVATDQLGDFSAKRHILLLCALAVPIGAVSAFAAYGLLWLISVITNLSFYFRLSTEPAIPQDNHLGFWVILVPVVGALIIGLMARYGSEKIRGHGIPEALEAILLGQSRIQVKVAILKPISSAISIGTGGPFGAEGPIIMTGGALGSIFAQQFHLTSSERKTLLVAGASAGMSAVFATPVAAVLLAVELLLFEWKPRSLIPVAVASIVAAVIRVLLLGPGPIFPVIAHTAPNGMELLLAATLGLLSGLLSSLLTTLVYTCEDLFQKLPIHWMWWPAIGAVFVGLGGLFEPRVLGVGYDTIHSLLKGDLVGVFVLSLLLSKALIWSISLGSGTSGGVLAPLLIMGGCLGAFVGHWFPVGDSGLWAMIGMAATMAGTMRAPFTAMIFAIELTGDFRSLPALLLGCIASLGVTVLVMRRSILTEKLARRGHHIVREYSIDPFELARVQDVMDTEIPSVHASMLVSELSDRLANADPILSKRQATIILNDHNKLVGIISRGDLIRALREDKEGIRTVAEAGSPEVFVTFPDEPLHKALETMLVQDIGRLPVVDRQNPKSVVGYLGRASILSARLRLHEEENIRRRG